MLGDDPQAPQILDCREQVHGLTTEGFIRFMAVFEVGLLTERLNYAKGQAMHATADLSNLENLNTKLPSKQNLLLIDFPSKIVPSVFRFLLRKRRL